MKALRIWLTRVLTVIALVSFTLPLFAQQGGNTPAPVDPQTRKFKFAPVARPQPQLPPQAGKRRADPSYRKRWEALTPEQRKEIWEIFQKYVGPEVAKAAAEHADERPGPRRLEAGDVDRNKAPKVKASASVTSGRAPLTVTFTAEGRDADGVVTSYRWSFGDPRARSAENGLASGAAVTHVFEEPGRYVVSVLATDDRGRSAIDHVLVRVDGPNGEPAPTALGAPAVRPPYREGAIPRRSAGAKIAANSADNDGDGLPEDFERQLADQFTPAYALSFWEYPWTGMSLFEDRSDAQVPVQTFPTYFWSPTTPTSYFRVTPLRVVNGLSYLRVDYLSLWNGDDGLALNSSCGTDIDILSFFGIYEPYLILPFLGGHFLDNERSAFRVVAPAAGPWGNEFNLDPNAYVVDAVYTAAHEGTFFDHSFLFPFLLYPNEHLVLFSSLSKHATYPFYPHGYPLLPWWLIYSIYFGIDIACWYFDWWICDFLYWIADEVVFNCLTEKHAFQGIAFTPDHLRINVGEVDRPLPGGSFINTPALRSKLLQPIF